MPTPKLSDTARSVLTAASAHPDQLAITPARLPTAAQRAVMQSLQKAGLLEEIEADDDQPAWRTTDEGLRFALRLTTAGLEAINPAPDASDTKQPCRRAQEPASQQERAACR